jgi:serine/threonine protein kinase/tetratricopeptide (TPR) repeat protein
MDDPSSQEETIFEAARQLGDPQKQAAYLEQACGGDLALRQRVERLLRAGRSAKGFFQRHDPAALLREGGDSTAAGSRETAGSVIGRYKLLQKIGEGGMGVVYLAEQEEPVRRRVALKIIKLGMDTRQVVARFEAERQALALMDHPNIARVLDGGATETGRPYFVMELVQGVPITEFCDQNHLSVEGRLKLFVPVCQAIQSAHQKGIVHRDLKPSNILVSLNPEGAGFPRIIDFGVAKAISQKLTEKTLFTAHGMMVGTPAYMSPEQAELSNLDVDTRADIYSLGALLYELLVGSPPFPEQRLRSAGYNEMQRIILEEQPVKPSTRLSTLQGEQRSIVARNRGASELTLGRAFPGDLDWIVMKCLEKDRARRYETANGLARDLERQLNHEPVLARPPSRLYEFQRTVRRHWVGFAAVAAVLVALAGGVGVSTLEAVRARRAEGLAKQRLADAETISRFLTDVFESPDPARSRTITVAESLAAAGRKLESDLSTQPERRAELEATLGRTYQGMGLYQEAVPLQEKVRDHDLAAYGPEDRNTLGAMLSLATSYYHLGRGDEALKLREQALAVLRRQKGPADPHTVGAMSDLGLSYAAAGRQAEALKLMEEALALSRKMNGPEHRDTLAAMNNLAATYPAVGRWPEAQKLLEEALPLFRKVEGPEHPDTLAAMITLGALYQGPGHWPQAMKLLEEALPLCRKVKGPEHPDTQHAMFNLSTSYLEAGRMDEGIKLREDLLVIRRKTYGPQHPGTLNTMWRLAESYCSVGRGREAITLVQQLCELEPKSPDWPLALATYQTWFGLDTDYQATCKRLVEAAERPDQAWLAEVASRACCLRPSTNAALLNPALELARKAAESNKTNAWTLLAVGLAEYRNGHYAAAEQTLTLPEQAKQTLTKEEQASGKWQQIEGTARLFRAMSVFGQGRTNEARTLFRQAEQQMTPFPKDEGKPFADIEPMNQSYDLLIWWLACKEARSELGESAAATAGAPKP